MQTRARGRRAALPALLALIAAGAAVRWVAMEQSFPIRPYGDELYYAVVATNIASGRGHVYGARSRALRPPGYAYFLSRFVDVRRPPVDFGSQGNAAPVLHPQRLYALLAAQVALGTLLIPLAGLLARELFDTRTGLLAAAITAVYPVFVAYSHYLWSETLFAVLVTAALCGVVRVGSRPSWVTVIATGAAFGLAALTREIALAIAGVAALWWVWTAPSSERGGAAARGVLVLAVALLVVLPWTLRNQRLFQRLVPVSTVGGLALGEGNALEHPAWWRVNGPARRAFRREYFNQPGEIERLDFARKRALALVAAEQPTWILEKLVRGLSQLLRPDSFLHYKLRNGAYGELSPALRRALLIPTELAYIGLVVAGILGVATAGGRGRAGLAGLVFGCVAVVHVIANANSRFRMPWMPLLVAYASHALVGGRATLSALGARGGRGWIAAGLAGLVFAAVCALHYLGILGLA